jgi:hypothetical protein
MSLPTFTLSFVGTPPYFSGTGTSTLVPDVYPVAINGRPYMVDQKSGRFQRGYEQRVRDSQDISTAPGESAINPGGLWRRGQDSWHLGAGQKYADTADAQDFRFYKSKGINVWDKGRISLLNSTALALSSANTNLFMCVVRSSGGTEYLYVADGSTLKYTTDPFAGTVSWTSVTTGSPGTAITGLETNGENVFIGYTSNDIYTTTPGSSSVSLFYPTSGTANQTYYAFGYAKARGFAAVAQDLYAIGLGSGGHTVFYDNPDTTMRWVGAAPGANAIYAAAYSGEHSYIYKITIKTDGTLDVPVVALELPVGEIVSAIYGYLGFIMLGTNKGVRFCSPDSNNNLVAGSIIPTSSPVYDFTAEDKYVWFGWTNYDGASSGLGRLDLSQFTATNTPAFSSDLMYADTSAVKSVTSFGGKRLFSLSGIGVIAEDTGNLVTTGTIESGIYRWGIPDRKFVAKVDVRAEPLVGSVKAYLNTDEGGYESLDTWSTSGSTEYTYNGTDTKAIEASFKFDLSRATATTGPTVTRWMARAYAAPFRSQVFVVPIVLHEKIRLKDKDYYINVQEELDAFDRLIESPTIVVLQIGHRSHTVIVEDLEWSPLDHNGNDWDWDGTLTVTMRSVEN